jgi:hypothetical protein
VAVLDIQDLLKKSSIFPSSYSFEGAYSLKSMTLCASIQVRGVYTSENLYNNVTLPTDMRFKFAFDMNKWEEYFDWREIPSDWERRSHDKSSASLRDKNFEATQRNKEEDRKMMSKEIDDLINRQKQVNVTISEDDEFDQHARKTRVGKLPDLSKDFMTPGGSISDRDVSGYMVDERSAKRQQMMNLQGLQSNKTDYVSGQFIGTELKRSPKLRQDPVMELKHIIGYSPDRCPQIRWSRFQGENVAIFTTGGTIVAMDVDNNS